MNTDIDVRGLADGARRDALPTAHQTVTAPAAHTGPNPPDHDARHVRHVPLPAGAVQVHAAPGGVPPGRARDQVTQGEAVGSGGSSRNRTAAAERVGGGARAGAREDVREEARQRGLEHGRAGAHDAGVGLDDGPDRREHGGVGGVGGGGGECEGRHAQD